MRAGDESGASSDLNEADRLAEKESDVRFAIGTYLIDLGRPADAIAQFDLWIPAHPTSARLNDGLNGRCWSRALLNRNLDKALGDCNAAVRNNPKNFASLDSRGLVFLRRGEFAKAIADYDAALAIQPKRAWSLYGRGLAKLKSGGAVGGKADVAAALAVNPNMAAQAAKYRVTP